MHQHAENLWTVDRPLRFFGLALGTRMTVVRLPGGLWLHSPVAPDPDLEASLAALGPVRWVVAPCALHHLFVGPWLERGGDGWCARPLQTKRADLSWAGVLEAPSPWADAGIDLLATRSLPFNDEVVFLHRPSRTLILSDLLFNIGAETPGGTRVALRCAGLGSGPQTSLLERVLMKRDLAREELREILDWDFDRVVLAHGSVIEADGKRALRQAYRWLLGS